jgi:NADH-quinone oxidoreductase subunit N
LNLYTELLGLSPVGVLVLAQIVLFVQDLVKEGKRLSQYISAAALAVSCLLSVYLASSGNTVSFANSTFVFNSLAYYFGVIFSLSALLVMLSAGSFLSRAEYAFEFSSLAILGVLGSFFVASSTNLVALFVVFEMATTATYGMVAYARRSKLSAEAAIKYFVVGAVSAGIIIYGISLIYIATGSVSISSVFSVASQSSQLLDVGVILLIVGFGFKIAAFPFHMWLPDTYEGAPYPATTYLASVSKVMGFAALVRIFLVMGPAIYALGGLNWEVIFGLLSILTMTFGNLAALVQTSMKRMLAYSSIAMSGYMLIGLALGTSFSYAVLLYFMLTYAIAKAGSFIVAQFFESEHNAKSIDDYAWLARKSPLSAFSLTIMLLSLAGIPPLSVFVAKFFIFYASVQVGGYWILLAIAGVLNSALSLYYYARVIKNMYIGLAGESPPPQGARLERIGYMIPILTCLVLTIALGLGEGTVIAVAKHAVTTLSATVF